jgi:anti-anti-sigma regulatory factor
MFADAGGRSLGGGRWLTVSGRYMATVTGLSPGDHVCWPFRGMDALVAAARDYVAEGLERHERVSYCRITTDGMQHAVISDVAQVGTAPGGARPVVVPVTPVTGWTPSAGPLAALAPMTRAAVAAGYTGLRVFTDATEIARDLTGRRRWIVGEHRIDRFVLSHPAAVLCGYDVDELGLEVLAEVACVHARTGGAPCPFLLRATDAGGALALSGEVDRESAVDLYHALVLVAADVPGPVVLDLSEHEFIDQTALVALDRAAAALGTRFDLVAASPLTARVVDALGLTGVTTEGTSPWP